MSQDVISGEFVSAEPAEGGMDITIRGADGTLWVAFLADDADVEVSFDPGEGEGWRIVNIP